MTVAQGTRLGHDTNGSPRGAGGRPGLRSTPPRVGIELGRVRLPGRMGPALRLFRAITGLTAVTSLATPLGGSAEPSALSPPIHPRCARRLRSGRRAPCREEWFIHLRSSRRSPSLHTHVCPIGLRCACVPIQFDGHLIGVTKLVVGPETPDRAFSTATTVLKLIVNGVCQDSLVSGLSEEVETLRHSVAALRQIGWQGHPVADSSDLPVGSFDESAARRHHLTLVEDALSHLHRHYKEPDLSLAAVAEALECNPRYLTARFTLIAGEHMHTYLVRLRVAHACRLLMESTVPVKEVEYESGFRGNGALARAFRRHVGVSPGDYRRIFAAR